MRTLMILSSLLCLTTPLPARASSDLPREVVINGVELVLIPGGEFFLPTMRRDDPKQAWRIDNILTRDIKAHVDSFYLGKYEARARDFARLMNERRLASAADYGPRANMKGEGENNGCAVRLNGAGEYFLLRPEDDLPATHLSWNLARDFAAAMGFRLPTNAEWTRAFRGDDQRVFPWGNEHPDDTFAAFQEGASQCHMQPVHAFPKGVSPYGVFNMAGNVFEYVADWMNHPYMESLKDGVRNPLATEPYLAPWIEEPVKMLRGGRWASGVYELSIRANYDTHPPHLTFNCYGVRFVADLDTVRQHLRNGTAQIVR